MSTDATNPENAFPWIVSPHRVKLPTVEQLSEIPFHVPFRMPGRDPKDPNDCAVYAAEGAHPLLADGTCADCAAGPFTK